MAQDAPAAIALAKSPEYLMPPSAITGTSPAARAASMIAVSCGTPTPATIRVVQIDPGPIPTFTASAPAPISARVASAVATLPATTCTAFDSALIRSTARATPSEWPCAVSITTMSTPASISACDRSNPASPDGRGRRHPQPPQLVLAGLRVQHGLFGILQRQQARSACPARPSPAASRSAAPSSG